jgi:hypothetical protein
MSDGGWLGWIVDYFRRRAALNQLERLDDYLLQDLGLRRDQLDALRAKGNLHADSAGKPPRGDQRPKDVRRPRRVARPSLQGCG